MKKTLCKHSKSCPTYNGKKELNGLSLTVYKNVFCNRGEKGWDNCGKFFEYKSQELLKTKNDQ